MGNAGQLQRALENLLENALKFTPPLGTISLTLKTIPDNVTLTVTNTGMGNPPEDLPRFHRGRNATAYPGNRLGLAIVKAVVKAHNGEIHAQSTVRSGAQMTISLAWGSLPCHSNQNWHSLLFNSLPD